MRRPATVLALGLIAGVALTGCRTSPNVAAYVGDETITVAELQDAVADRRADPELTTGEDPAYSRDVLAQLVRAEVFDAAAEHFGVSADPGGLTELLATLIQGRGTPEDYFAQEAEQGRNRADALEPIRQYAILTDIAVAEGAAERPTDASLRAAYDEAVTQQPAQLSLGYINVTDQATADRVVADLQADPERYAEIAAPYADGETLPAPRTVTVEQVSALPPDLAAQVLAAAPGDVFASSAEGVPGLLVVVVGEAPFPSFEEVRPELETRALTQAAEAGAEILAEFEADLDVDVNPRYGSIEQGAVVEAGGGVVRLLDPED